MNDEEEILGFYDRVLPDILRPIFLKHMGEIKDQPRVKKEQRNKPFEHFCEEQFKETIRGIKNAASLWHDYYITSFSKATDTDTDTEATDTDCDHGLLSQWRAYGPDGGYALVLDTAALDRIISEEVAPYQEEDYLWTDVQYGLNKNCRTDDPDTNKLIGELEVVAGKFFRSNSDSDAEELSKLLTILSSVFKHPGFFEEREVRLVLSLLGTGLEFHPELESTPQQTIKQHPIMTRVQEGATVPFVALCVREESGVRQHLPIKRIIIGPHRDKNDRKRAVQLLLKQHGLSDLIDKVSVSDIPYRGR